MVAVSICYAIASFPKLYANAGIFLNAINSYERCYDIKIFGHNTSLQNMPILDNRFEI